MGSASTVLQNKEFIGLQRNRVKTRSYYIAETTKKETIIHFLNSKGIFPTLLNLFASNSTWNIGGIILNVLHLQNILKESDICVLLENWLYPHSLTFLSSVNEDFVEWGR